MSGLLDRVLGVFRKPKQVEPPVLLTLEKITERLASRPAGNELRRAGPLPQPTPIHVAAEVAAPPLHEPEFAVSNVPDAIKQHSGKEPGPEVDRRGGLDDRALFNTLAEKPALIIASELEPVPVARKEISWAGESYPLPPEEPAVEHQPVRTAPDCLEEILAEFHALMHKHFGREKPKAEPVIADVLKILELDKRELISPPSTVSAPLPEVEVIAFSEPQAAIETPEADAAPREAEESIVAAPCEPEITAEPVIIADETQAVGEADASTPWKERAIGEVMLESDCTVRLANCIAANQDFFSDWTVGRTLANRSEFAAALMHVRNLGRKTANEALDVLEAFALDPRVNENEPAWIQSTPSTWPSWMLR